jgi:molybdenum cofactor cytidylyltransferase
MQFGSFPLDHCEGAILAHSQAVADGRLRKGKVLTHDDLLALDHAGITEVVVARLEPGDVHEDAAAARLAEACAGAELTLGTAATGRVNLFAARDGLAVYAAERLHAVNGIDEAITVAAVDPHARVSAGQIVATLKIIPFAVPETTLHQACQTAHRSAGRLLRVAPFRAKQVGLVQTRLSGTTDKVLTKTERAIEDRVRALNSRLVARQTVPHTGAAVAEALAAQARQGCELILVVGASATTDRRDVIPTAIAAAGGAVQHYGMPVDPGNLLVVGTLNRVPVLALPGSARSPKTGGNDWVLWRLCADLPVDSATIMRMGAGGLLKDIPARPLPREEAAPAEPRAPQAPWRIGAVILAAGSSRRMGDANKLLTPFADKPLVRHGVESACASGADPVVLVTGHESAAVAAVVRDLDTSVVENPDHGSGMASSLRAGIAALPPGLDGVVVMLGDMPAITAGTIDRLIAAFDPAGGHTICVPEYQGTPGHPVLFARRFFPALQELSGDIGAKPILREHADQIATVPVGDVGITIDLDTPAAFRRYGAASSGPASA